MDKKVRAPKAPRVQTITGINPKMILDAFNNLSGAKGRFYTAAITALRNKEELESWKAEALIAGRIVGKNTEEREACARMLFPDKLDVILENEIEEKLARLSLDEAEVQVEKVKALLRLEEVMSQSELTAFNQALVERSDGWPDHLNEGKG